MEKLSAIIIETDTLYPGAIYIVKNKETKETIASGTFEGFFPGKTEYMNVFKNATDSVILPDSFLANEAIVMKVAVTAASAA